MLVKSKCKLAKNKPVRLYPRVIIVCFSIFKRLVKQVASPDRNETVPLGQTITDVSIDHPEIILAGLKTSSICVIQIKMTLLMIVSCLQLGTQSKRVEKINP